MLDRVLGAAIAATLAVTIVLVAVLFLRSTKLLFGIDNVVAGSAIARTGDRGGRTRHRHAGHHSGLDLCGGRLARILSEVCDEDGSDRLARCLRRDDTTKRGGPRRGDPAAMDANRKVRDDAIEAEGSWSSPSRT